MLAIGCDHGGFELKQAIMEHLREKGIEYYDFGCYSTESMDYPTVAEPLAQAIADGTYERGILICGTGIGMSIAANKVKGIRAACCENAFSAQMAREHNDAHILCLGARVLGPAVALTMVDAFLNSSFAGGRHCNRVNLISEMECK
ncbi:ribose 5-phosphate isomerase B [Christensenella sp. MSJ-20]|uniref:ribose 5-phosphate isomerase B n=1 Tax=Christensenella sp. MSJ-20 TaxID=2841518 RepID=UPI000D7B5F52|nr:MAG: ribose 5-phosphate isomerase B [Bacillota bacterium]QWT54528.1 ribose 5-phosphate isomerase B [Christensenella sp. MSJ-20]